MPRLLRSSAAALLLVAAVAILGSGASAQGASQTTTVTRIVLAPFDAARSLEVLGLAAPAAIARALNQVDGLFVPPVGDALLVLQRASLAGADPIAEMQRLFTADAIVLARIVGNSAIEVELVVIVGDEDRADTVRGSIAELPTLLRTVAERILALAGIRAGPADTAAVRGLLAAVPEVAVLGPLGTASARLPGVRLSDLETALALAPDHPWLLSEGARLAALEGRADTALGLAERAAAVAPADVEVRTVEGVVRSAAGDRDGAAAAFRAALEGNPAHGVALAGLAELSDDPAERAALLERAVAASPRLVEAQLGLAQVQTTPQRRLQALRRAAERLPDSIAIQQALVEEVLSGGDARGALSLLRDAASHPVGASAALYALSALLPGSVGEDALVFVREGRERFPASQLLAFAEADLLVAAGDLPAAEGVLRGVLAEDPGSLLAAEALSTVLARLGRIDEAREVLLALEARPDDLELRLVELQLAAGRARAALAELEPRMAAGEADLEVRTLYGIALGRVGRIDEARAALQGVLDEDPDAEVAERALGMLEERRRLAGDEALQLEGDVAIAFEQGLYALEMGEFASAAAAFEQARELVDDALLAFYHGFALHQQGDVRAAITAYQAARAALGDNDVLLNNLGFAQLQVGRVDLALDTLRAAVGANADNPQAQLNLGLAYYRIGSYGEALRSFERAFELAPGLETSVATFVEEARRRTVP